MDRTAKYELVNRIVLIISIIAIGGGYSFAQSGSDAYSSGYAGRSNNVTSLTAVASQCNCKKWHLSTDLAGWGALVANVTAEMDFAHRWSLALGLRYSAWDYGKVVRKFRTFEFRPELRYWFGSNGAGFYADAHLALIYYNIALDNWKYRIQDRGGKHPALGGGLGAGYRLNFASGRWAVDFNVGLGVYSLEYDRFKNERNGALVDSRKRTFLGVDRLGVSLVYNFNAGKR